MMRLSWHGYQYYPYERELATREMMALLNNPVVHEIQGGFELDSKTDCGLADRLTYIARYSNGNGIVDTVQSLLERTTSQGSRRQSTRYSVHGLHEYKGKFNPQVVRALLNIFEVMPGHRVLDPFCGSGTTLVECSHIGVESLGVDINPFAVYVANAKLKALITPANILRSIFEDLSKALSDSNTWRTEITDDPRSKYLQSWFDNETLQRIETVREVVEEIAGEIAPVFLASASNLLRDYSFQDPQDLRTRRRKSSMPTVPYFHALQESWLQAIERIESAQSILDTQIESCKAEHRDISVANPIGLTQNFDVAITSPPYAMALPYIDMHRLSLVWLNLVQPESLDQLEASLIGSRELRGDDRKEVRRVLELNEDSLLETEYQYCCLLMTALKDKDGFRRQAVPALLYRYFALMQNSFQTIRKYLRPQAPFALVVGDNHSVLGGVRFDFNTPEHLVNIATSVGWTVEEIVPLQTYRRYGYHAKNAIAKETLIILRNST